jgi:hypothetical protein
MAKGQGRCDAYGGVQGPGVRSRLRRLSRGDQLGGGTSEAGGCVKVASGTTGKETGRELLSGILRRESPDWWPPTETRREVRAG